MTAAIAICCDASPLQSPAAILEDIRTWSRLETAELN